VAKDELLGWTDMNNGRNGKEVNQRLAPAANQDLYASEILCCGH
jgi:hypothetical protein